MSESLSIVIPARNEMFLKRTVEEIIKNMRGDKTEIIAICDGNWPDPPLDDHPKVTLIHHSVSVGQRAAANEAAKLSRAKYIMKVDAHCSFDEGFDVKMMSMMQDNWTVVPIMRNLHAFDWRCNKCGDTRYQGPTPTNCPKCDNTIDFEKDIKWIGKGNPQSTSYCFDPEPHFQYFVDFKSRPEYKESRNKTSMTETMSLQGSCFMCTRDKWFELELCDETFGSWGSQGIEVAVKTWLSGGRVLCNHTTWYSHMFRTQGGDFGFPWPCSGRQVSHAKKYAKDLFFNNKWPKAIYPLSWLIEKFWPVQGWKQEDLDALKSVEIPRVEAKVPTIGILYYTDNRLDEKIMATCREQLVKAAKGKKIVSVSLQPIDFGENLVLPLERGHLTMFKQILAGLEKLDTDVVYMCEHDVIYPEEHFEFVPPKQDVYYYDENWWKVRNTDGQALFFRAKQLSGCCAYRELLINHYKLRIERVEREGSYNRSMGFEPGCHWPPKGIDFSKAEAWWAKKPHVDIRHENTITPGRFRPEQYRNPNSILEWKLSDEVPGWGRTKDRFQEFLDDLKGDKKMPICSVCQGNHTELTCDHIRKIEPLVLKKEPTIGLVYYTDFRCDEKILKAVRQQLLNCSNGWDIVSVSLNKPVDFGRNVVLYLQRGYLTMFKQQLAGIEASKEDILFMVEHDVLYHPSHFEFRPPKKDIFYYNENRWFVDSQTGHALFYHAGSVSMMCAYREVLLAHYKARVEKVEKEGFNFRLGFEPGNRRPPRGVDNYGREMRWSDFPCIDIRHGLNLLKSRWKREEFRNQKTLWAWKEADEVPGWGKTKDRFGEILNDVTNRSSNTEKA